MYVKIHKEGAETYLNNHRVVERNNTYIVCGKSFQTIGEAVEYIASRDKQPVPNELKPILEIKKEEEIPLEMKWITARELSKTYDLNTAMIRALRVYWVKNYPKDILAKRPNSYYNNNNILHDTIKQIKTEMETGRPYNCPEKFMELSDTAKQRGISPGTLLTYITRGNIAQRYICIGQWTLTKYFLSPDWKWSNDGL
jgi:hypothetical protein